MAKRSAYSSLKEADDILYLLTGKRFKHMARQAVDLFGEDLIRKVMSSENSASPLNPQDPYRVLEIRRDASDLVVKASFRAKAKKYHPDTGDKPDTLAFQNAQEAYNTIMAEPDRKA